MGFDPISLAAMAAISTGGSLLQAKGAAEEGDAQAKAAEYNRALALSQSRAEGARLRRLGRREVSSQRVAFAKSGVRLEGSPLELLAQNAAEFEIQALNAEVEGRNTANLERMRAREIRRATRRRVSATLIGGATKIAGLGMQFGIPGGGGGAPSAGGPS